MLKNLSQKFFIPRQKSFGKRGAATDAIGSSPLLQMVTGGEAHKNPPPCCEHCRNKSPSFSIASDDDSDKPFALSARKSALLAASGRRRLAILFALSAILLVAGTLIFGLCVGRRMAIDARCSLVSKNVLK